MAGFSRAARKRAAPFALASLAFASVLAASLFGARGARAGEVGFASGAKLSKTDAVTATDSACTSSMTFADIPGASVTFRVGGRAPRPVILLFSAAVGGFGNDSFLWTRPVIDGVVQLSDPDENVTIDHPTGFARTGGYNSVSAALEPGAHTASIQWRVDDSGGTICIGPRTLIVLHK
jgi:hypothetical protein